MQVTVKKSFVAHIKELRSRVIYIVVFYIIAALICYSYCDIIYYVIASPLSLEDGRSVSFIYTNLTEAFISKLNLSAKFALLISVPFISFQLYKFIAPGLYKQEKYVIFWSMAASNILFFCGILFVYLFVMPKAFEFFISFQQDSNNYTLVLQAKISEYISLVTSLALSFGIAFQLPIFLLGAVALNLVSCNNLREYRRYAIVVIFIVAGIITPPDILSQLLLALPLIFLYEGTIIIAKRIDKQQAIDQQQTDKQQIGEQKC